MVRVTDGMSAYGSPAARTNRRPPAAAKRPIHRHRRLLHDVLFIHVRDDADNAAGCKTSTIGPQIGRRVERVAVGEQPLRHALVDDGHGFLVVRSLSVKSRPGEDRDAEHSRNTQAKRFATDPSGFFAIRGLVALGDKLQLCVPAVARGTRQARSLPSRHPARPAARRSAE